MLRHGLHFALFLCVLLASWWAFEPSRVSEEVLDLFPHNEDKALIEAHRHFASSRYVPLAVRGYDEAHLREVLDEVRHFPQVESIITSQIPSELKLLHFLTQNEKYLLRPQDSNNQESLPPSHHKATHAQVLESHTDSQTNRRLADSKINGQLADSNTTAPSKALDSKISQSISQSQNPQTLVESSKNRATPPKDSKDSTPPLATQNLAPAQEVFAPLIARLSHSLAHSPSSPNAPSPTAPRNDSSSSPQPNNAKPSHTTSSNKPQPTQPPQKPLIAQGYGLMALIELKPQDDSALAATLKEFQNLSARFSDVRYFSADFMRVENLHLILNEANTLLSLASLLFVLLYLLILRMPLLTLHSICTLIISNLIAIICVGALYPKVTIMALSFGLGISNIAIDYMMHHHFFSHYTHAKSTPPPLNRPVLYGYLTTMVGFGACLFVPFPLLAQLSVYAMISLTLSYVSFALIYPRVGFAPPRLFARLDSLRKPCVPSLLSLLMAGVCIAYASAHLRLDFDLSKLDYHNKPMLEMREFFSSLDTRQSLLLRADSQHSLALLARLAIDSIPSLEFYEAQSKGEQSSLPYAYLARFDKAQSAELEEFQSEANALIESQGIHAQIDTRPLQSLMDSLADSIYQPMIVVLVIALVLMLCALALSVRKAFVQSASFVLLPLGVALCVVASHSAFNMMHLFALLILVVVSVDYGIYAIKEGANPRTTHAIVFSALTTSLSFGILMFSHTKALNSFGEVIFSGMSCILALLLFGRINAPQKQGEIQK